MSPPGAPVSGTPEALEVLEVLAEAERWRVAGVAANARGRPEEGAEMLRRALVLIDGLAAEPATGSSTGPAVAAGPAQVRLRVQTLVSLSLCEFERGGLGLGTPLLDQAQALAEELAQQSAQQSADATPTGLQDAALVGLCHSQRANMLGRCGLTSQALAELDLAVDHLGALAPRDRWAVLVNRGMSRSQVGELHLARVDLAAAVVEAAGGGLVDEHAMALHDQGWIDFLDGDLPAALEAMSDAARLEVGFSDAIPSLDRGRVLLEAGLLDEAVRMLEHAVLACTEDGQGHAEQEATYELARAHLCRGEVDVARGLAVRARDQAAQRGASQWNAHATLLLAATGTADPRAARQIADDERLGPLARHEALLVVAEAHLRVGDHRAASDDLAQGRRVLGAARPALSQRLDAARVTAQVQELAGQSEPARSTLAQAARDLADAASYAGTLDLRTARAVHGRAAARLDLDLSLERGPAEAFAAAERWRATSAGIAGARRHRDAEVAGLMGQVRVLREQLRVERTGSSTVDAGLRRLAEMEGRVADAVRAGRPVSRGARARVPGPGGGAWLQHDREVGADELVEHLVAELAQDGADLVTTVVHGEDVVALAVVGGRPVVQRLGRASEMARLARRVRSDLAQVARHHDGPLAATVRGSLLAGATTVGSLVVDALPGLGERLVVVPHAELSGLPWALIAAGRAVCVAPSATAWSRGRSAAWTPRPAPPRVTVVSGPRLGQGPAEVLAVSGAWRRRSADVVQVSTVAGLRRALAQPGVVHVAAHGRHHVQNPMFSSVALDDGATFLYDLEEDGVCADHVVLAACDVGRSLVRPGDEPLGLAAGLLSLGARCVLAAICAVPDATSAAVMPPYHRALAAGSPSDVALLDALRGVSPEAAAFVVTGSPWSTGSTGSTGSSGGVPPNSGQSD